MGSHQLAEEYNVNEDSKGIKGRKEKERRQRTRFRQEVLFLSEEVGRT